MNHQPIRNSFFFSIKKVILSIILSIIFLSGYSQQWSLDYLAEGKNEMNVAVIGNKIFFHSGFKKVGSTLTRVAQLEILDVVDGTKEIINLPSGAPRYAAATAVLGSKVFIAGGDGNSGVTTRVDIYDTLTGVWTTGALSLDRSYFAAAAGDKVLFGGGGVVQKTTLLIG